MTVNEARNLTYGQVVHHNTLTNANGTCQNWRVNGRVKRWKTDPNRILVPIKRGLYEYGYIDQFNADEFHLPDQCLAHRLRLNQPVAMPEPET